MLTTLAREVSRVLLSYLASFRCRDGIDAGLLGVSLPSTKLLEISVLQPLAAAEEFAHLQCQSVFFREVAGVAPLLIWHMNQELLTAEEEVDQFFLLVLNEFDYERVTILVDVVNICAILVYEPRS